MRKHYEVPTFKVFRREKRRTDIICTSGGMFSPRSVEEVTGYMDGMGVKTGKNKYSS